MSPSELKVSIHEECLKILNLKLETIKNEFRLYQESAANETKSTAGDKHDTGKAMMQMEQEKLGVQLKELLNNKNLLLSIDPKKKLQIVNSGSLVFTDHGIFYIAVSLGKIYFDAHDIITISMQAPLSKALFNKVKDSIIVFNQRQYKIQNIC